MIDDKQRIIDRFINIKLYFFERNFNKFTRNIV